MRKKLEKFTLLLLLLSLLTAQVMSRHVHRSRNNRDQVKNTKQISFHDVVGEKLGLSKMVTMPMPIILVSQKRFRHAKSMKRLVAMTPLYYAKGSGSEGLITSDPNLFGDSESEKNDIKIDFDMDSSSAERMMKYCESRSCQFPTQSYTRGG